jgi:hypothetical protein
MVQIKDSVFRDSGSLQPSIPPHRSGACIRMMPRGGSAWPGGPAVGSGKDARTAFPARMATATVNNLSTTCQESLYVVDFRRVVRAGEIV